MEDMVIWRYAASNNWNFCSNNNYWKIIETANGLDIIVINMSRKL
jgi:hypothetical protein